MIQLRSTTRSIHIQLVERLFDQKLIHNRCLINGRRCFSSSEQTERRDTKANRHQRSNAPTRIKIQRTKWLDKKVDEIQKQNEPKESTKDDINELKAQYNLTEENQYEILNKELIPLYLIDYETQAKIKTRRLELFLEQFVNKIKKYSSTIVLDSEGHPCVIHDLITSDPFDEYQSQNEFQINLDVNGQIAVGLMFGSFKDNSLTCIRASKFVACKKSHRLLAEQFENYLNTKSSLKVNLDYNSKSGNWMNFFVRSNQAGEHQCLTKLKCQNLTKKELDDERKLLIEHFQSISGEFKIRSFSLETLKTHKFSGETESNVELLFGDPYLPVKYKDQIYNIAVKSLFPLNVDVYGKMIDSIIDNLDLLKSLNLVFIAPYSGLGLPDLAKSVKTLFLINKTEQQQHDCRKSLECLPGKVTRNMQFSWGKVSLNLFKILDNNSEEIGIILRQEDASFQILNELRDNPNVSKVVIVSTKPQENLMKFWVQLCLDNSNSSLSGRPFNFISATPIDSHPHSNIYTIVSVFERITGKN